MLYHGNIKIWKAKFNQGWESEIIPRVEAETCGHSAWASTASTALSEGDEGSRELSGPWPHAQGGISLCLLLGRGPPSKPVRLLEPGPCLQQPVQRKAGHPNSPRCPAAQGSMSNSEGAHAHHCADAFPNSHRISVHILTAHCRLNFPNL